MFSGTREGFSDSKYVDMHMHTRHSDGIDEPRTVLRGAHMMGMQAVSITDHDSIDAYAVAEPEAARLGLMLIPGVELSTTDYHILGYAIDLSDEGLYNVLNDAWKVQRRKCEEAVRILRADGVPYSMQKLEAEFPNQRLGSFNLFMGMMRDEECNSYLRERHPTLLPREMMKHYLGYGGIADVSDKDSMTPQAAIAAIHDAAGIAVLAHPFADVKQMSELDALLKHDLDGIEIQPHFAQQNEKFKQYALAHDLIVTYGSDYHGCDMPRPLLQRGENKVDVARLLSLARC